MPPESSIKSILKPATIAAIRGSTIAACKLLDPNSDFEPVGLTPARKLSEQRHALLKDLLLDPQSWLITKKQCLPQPTAHFRLQGKKGDVGVWINSCLGWTVIGPDERQSGFFDPVKDKVHELLKALFWEFASPDPESLWKTGVIVGLRERLKLARSGPYFRRTPPRVKKSRKRG